MPDRDTILVKVDAEAAAHAADVLYAAARDADQADPEYRERLREVGDQLIFKARQTTCHGEVELGGTRSRSCNNLATRRRETDGKPVCAWHDPDENPHEE